uniref:Uncharacterized protein n=1 Tax=uncultured Desulfobacterium sp. TaxID=201089 RepID=E1YGN4_9BACT|nr:unknown protein [uncultured Desulfobacterium sp.]
MCICTEVAACLISDKYQNLVLKCNLNLLLFDLDYVITSKFSAD